MTLSLYFFRQFLPSLGFGSLLFIFVLLLDRFFDLIDLIFNKGVNAILVGKILLLFIPTILPLSLPMAILLASLVTFGRLSEENELTAVRAGGLSLITVFWMPIAFTFALSVFLVPFNTSVAPAANRAFRTIYEQIVHADPLINVEPRKFFSVRNIRLFADSIDPESKALNNVFLYQFSGDNHPPDRIYAQSGTITSTDLFFQVTLVDGQLQRYDLLDPKKIIHSSFGTYQLNIPINTGKDSVSNRYSNVTSRELKKLINEMRQKGHPVNMLLAENTLRYAMAFAPIALLLVGLPLAVVLKRGGRAFGFGITIAVICVYYFLLIGGLTIAEKGLLPAAVSLWIANAVCFVAGFFLLRKMFKQ